MRWAAPVAALLACAAGCVSVPEVGTAPSVQDSSQERAYQQTLQRNSAHVEVYGTLDTKAFFATTLQSWEFRQARARRQAQFEEAPPSALQALLAKEKAADEQGVEFFLGAYVTDYHFDDFDRPDSVWRIALVTEAGEVTPTRVERVGRATYNLRGYYPYLGDFWTAYRVYFPKVSPAGAPWVTAGAPLTLKVASTLGQANLKLVAP